MGRTKTFNEQQREEIYNKFIELKSYRAVAKEFGVSMPFVKHIVDEIECGGSKVSKIDVYIPTDMSDPAGLKYIDADDDTKIENIVKISVKYDGMVYRLKNYASIVANEMINDRNDASNWLNDINELIETNLSDENIIKEISSKIVTKSSDEGLKLSKRLNNMKEYIQGHPVNIDGDLWYDRDGISKYIEKNMYDINEYAKGSRIRAYENEDKKRFDDLRKRANDIYDLIELNIDKSNNINKLNEIGLELSRWYIDIFNKHCTCKSAITSLKILPEKFCVHN